MNKFFVLIGIVVTIYIGINIVKKGGVINIPDISVSPIKDLVTSLTGSTTQSIVTVRGANQTITIPVELADSILERTLGLSDRASLASSTGLLFVFERPGLFSFWMKDMKFPIDIIWIGEDKKANYIAKNIATSTYPESFISATSSLYVLELNAGDAKRFGIVEGTQLEF